MALERIFQVSESVSLSWLNPLAELYGSSSLNAMADITRGTHKGDVIHGTGEADTIIGLAGDDVIAGDAGDDIIDGSEGNDQLYGGAGSDTINGGDGSDEIHGGGTEGGNTLNGGNGSDVITAGAGGDTLDGGDNDDTLYGGAGDDTIYGGSGGDHIFSGQGNDVVYGGLGPDVIFVKPASNGSVTVYGWSDGLDRIFYDGPTLYWSQRGEDLVLANVSDFEIVVVGATIDDIYDRLWINGGLIRGAQVDDQFTLPPIVGSDGRDVIQGDPRVRNEILGLAGDDVLKGGSAADTLKGGSGNDRLLGFEGPDTLLGGKGRDTLKGDVGKDTLNGGKGRDRLIGGDDDDTMTGGAGRDVFIFKGKSQGHDTITDFDSEQDRLRIKGVAEEDIELRETDNGTLIEYGDSIILLEDVFDFSF